MSFLSDKKIDLNLLPWDRPDLSKEYGGIFLGDPQLGNHSVLRSNFGHNKYTMHTQICRRNNAGSSIRILWNYAFRTSVLDFKQFNDL